MALDVHFQAGVNCHDCHGGDPSSFDVPEAHSVDAPEGGSGIEAFRFPLSAVQEACGTCHQEQQSKLNVGGIHMSAPDASTAAPESDASATKSACIACHAENVHQMRNVDDPQSPANPANRMKTCGQCHEEALAGLEAGVHTDEDRMGGLSLNCATCHGKKVHEILPVEDTPSPVSLNDQIRLCGRCHLEVRADYRETAHGRALELSGLSVTAVCSDCHGAHGIFPATDARSVLYEDTVGATCGRCHQFLEERIQKSVHGVDPEADEDVLAEDAKRKPTCIVCHQGHEAASPKSKAFRFGVAHQCSDCHAELYSGFAISMHGSLTALGYGPAAACADCHGAHDILPISDPDSQLSDANRLATCQKCHPAANKNFADFDPHSDHRKPDRDPIVYWVYMVLMTLLISTFSIFGLHSLLWCTRSLIEVKMHGRPGPLVPGTVAYVRFKPMHRVAHTIMVLSFLGLALTGLPLKYSQLDWAKVVAHILGGFESTAVAHRIFGLVNGGCLVFYVFLMSFRILQGPANGGSRLGMIFGPDSPLPSFRDVKDIFGVIRWFTGMGPKPTFERWAYWEKVDLWGASADIVIIGATGLILWFPAFFCLYLPGEVLNIAKVIHSTQALLATGFVFTIHFISTHLRPEKFPMDMAVLTGLVSEEDMEEERPEYLERMRREGRLEELKAIVPPRDVLWMIKLGGFVGLSIGLALLAGILAAVLMG